MTKQAIIEKTVRAMNNLPDDKVQEVSDFADFVIKRYEEYLIAHGMQELASQSKAFDFLNTEEDLYSMSDLKEVYND